MKNKYPVLSGFIKMRREMLKLTQRQVGAFLGMPGHFVYKMERGYTRVGDAHFLAMAKILEVKAEDLRTLKEVDMMINK